MQCTNHVLRRAAALSAVACGLTGAVAAVPATAASRRPPCTRTALRAGLARGADKNPTAKIAKGKGAFGCSGNYAYAFVNTKLFTYTAVFKATGTRWATINRAKPCTKKLIPKKIYRPACLSD